MSGHSKWSKVKHQKATTDVVKSAAFTKATHAITIAVKEGGGITDPNGNFHLRLAIEKARAVNMPKENIERAISRAAGSGSESIEQVLYEGYAPGGIALILEAATDNRQRTVAQIKSILEHGGGTLSTPGSVKYLFNRRGVLTISKQIPFDDLFAASLDVGAQDVVETDDYVEVYTTPESLFQIKSALEGKGIQIDNATLIMFPLTTRPGDEAKVIKLIEELEALDDVQTVYSNLQ